MRKQRVTIEQARILAQTMSDYVVHWRPESWLPESEQYAVIIHPVQSS